jgi:surface polysaccharide O-acyltransferase-like enzyme
VWLLVGLSLAGIWYVYDLWLMERIAINDMLWGVIFPFWETLLCCAMCIGLTILFRDRLNRQGPLLTEMAKSTYGAYMIHVFIVFFVQYLVFGFAASPLAKFLLVSLIAVFPSFLLASLIRKPLRI